MPVVPRRRRDGTLPPGVHPATLDEVLAAYPPTNQQRQILNDALQCAVRVLRQLDPTLVIYVDGSDITNKAEPNDVDLLIIGPISQLDLITYLDQHCPVEAVSLDVNVEPTTPNPLFDLFVATRRGTAKGIIQIS